MNEKTTRAPESLQVQLAELNARARAYTARLWQVPFAYIGIVGVVLAQVADKKSDVLATTLLYCALFGIAILVQMTALLEGTKRAVENIRMLEWRLGLERTAEYRPVLHIGPLFGIVLLCVLLALCHWFRLTHGEPPRFFGGCFK